LLARLTYSPDRHHLGTERTSPVVDSRQLASDYAAPTPPAVFEPVFGVRHALFEMFATLVGCWLNISPSGIRIRQLFWPSHERSISNHPSRSGARWQWRSRGPFRCVAR